MLTEQVNEAYVLDAPFSYYWYDNFFTDELYRLLVNNLPDKNLFEEFYHADAVTDYGSTRHRFIFTDESIAKLDITKQCLWWNIFDELRSPSFKAVLFNKLKKDLLERFGTLDIKCEPTVLIYKDFSGYKISPHPDHHSKVATVQFYLPQDNSMEDMGTSLYNKTKDGFTIHHKMKFAPRHGYGFAVSKKSWHGVEKIETKDIERNSLMVIYYQHGK